MNRSRRSIIAYLVIGLGAVGLTTQFFKNPASLFKSLFLMLIVGLIIFSIIYFFVWHNRKPSNDMQKYYQAVKQSKLKYKKTNPYLNSKQSNHTRKPGNYQRPHLRVIEGNKSKRKNRATF